MRTVSLRPGLLVQLKTRMNGGVTYQRTDLFAEVNQDGPRLEKWETLKTVIDPEEHARAVKVRGRASNLIRGACVPSEFGLLCLGANEELLNAKVAEAREMVAAFNQNAKTVNIGVFVLKGRIAESDSEAARSILSEMQDLLVGMRDGIRAGNIEAVRKAASQAKKVAAMLDPNTQRTVEDAVSEAREFARKATALSEAGEDAVKSYVQGIKFDKLDEARFQFLDTEATAPVAAATAEMPDLDLSEPEPVKASAAEPQFFLVDDNDADDDDNAA